MANIRISRQGLILLKETKERVKDAIGLELSYDQIIRLVLEKPTVIVIGRKRRGKKQYEGLFGGSLE